jgi:hypothetical protein
MNIVKNIINGRITVTLVLFLQTLLQSWNFLYNNISRKNKHALNSIPTRLSACSYYPTLEVKIIVG